MLTYVSLLLLPGFIAAFHFYSELGISEFRVGFNRWLPPVYVDGALTLQYFFYKQQNTLRKQVGTFLRFVFPLSPPCLKVAEGLHVCPEVVNIRGMGHTLERRFRKYCPFPAMSVLKETRKAQRHIEKTVLAEILLNLNSNFLISLHTSQLGLNWSVLFLLQLQDFIITHTHTMGYLDTAINLMLTFFHVAEKWHNWRKHAGKYMNSTEKALNVEQMRKTMQKQHKSVPMTRDAVTPCYSLCLWRALLKFAMTSCHPRWNVF